MAKYIVAMILALSPAIASAQSAGGTTGGVPAATNPPTSTSAAGLYGPPAPTVEAHTRMPAATATPAASDGTQTPQKHRGRRRGSYAGTEAGIGG